MIFEYFVDGHIAQWESLKGKKGWKLEVGGWRLEVGNADDAGYTNYIN